MAGFGKFFAAILDSFHTVTENTSHQWRKHRMVFAIRRFSLESLIIDHEFNQFLFIWFNPLQLQTNRENKLLSELPG